eukprot:197405_1
MRTRYSSFPPVPTNDASCIDSDDFRETGSSGANYFLSGCNHLFGSTCACEKHITSAVLLYESFTISMVQIKNDELLLLFVLVNIHHLPLFLYYLMGAFHFFALMLMVLDYLCMYICYYWGVDDVFVFLNMW